MKPQIHIYDQFTPEDTAMLQALYSRSPRSVTEHVDKVQATGSGKFMETYYIGYNHKSIGDCGTTTLFLEGVSELAAKAIQDWPLYSGQQTSTRYIDFTTQPMLDPLAGDESLAILNDWKQFYSDSLQPMAEALAARHPRGTEEPQRIWEKAIRARSFDVLRAFLPAAVTTQLSWHSNLRQAWDKLSLLQHHPLQELRALAQVALDRLAGRYPHSFAYKRYPEQDAYQARFMEQHTYYGPRSNPVPDFSTSIDLLELQQYRDLLVSRPRKTELPHFLEELGQVRFAFTLDFGSFRDLQRHRHGVCRMPLLTARLGFEPWYLEQLPDSLRTRAEALIARQTKRIQALQAPEEVLQYYHAMGFRVDCRLSYGLPAAVYVVELRSGITVHPTLRRVAHWMHHALEEAFPLLRLHSDLTTDVFSASRGTQDIVERENSPSS